MKATPANIDNTHIIANTLNGMYCDKSKAIVNLPFAVDEQ